MNDEQSYDMSSQDRPDDSETLSGASPIRSDTLSDNSKDPGATVVESNPVEVYAVMQARLIALLLRHDSQRFRDTMSIHTAYAAQPDDTTLRHYRELAVLFHLRDDLFEHILPRIVRRLSFDAPRSTVIEEPPARGRIDWERTLGATWHERPDQPPLVLHTHQRHRDFATPENLLTVATLLDYRADIQHIVQHEYETSGNTALHHPLTESIGRCERELAFPQFAALRQSVQHWRERADDDEIAALEQQVRERFIPGSNSAYEELLNWRVQRRSLQLLQRTPAQHAPPAVLGADPQRDNYLYQLWIFYELVDMLHQTGNLKTVNPARGQMCLSFWWGDNDTRCCYEVRHDQAVPQSIAQWYAEPQASDIPGVRPDFLLRRIDPPAQCVTHSGTTIWREPGLIWDAKYYRERDTPRTPASPIKRMLADLTLLGETCGILLFAFLKEEEAHNHSARILMPVAGRDQTIIPTLEIQSHCIQPSHEAGAPHVTTLLHNLLDDMHRRLHQPRIPRCHGIFLDNLSTTAHKDMPAATNLRSRDGTPLGNSLDTLVLCPKPHIGSWRVDIVNQQHDCGRNPYLCHIIGQPGISTPQRLTNLHDIAEAINQASTEDDPDAKVAAANHHVLAITQRYAQLVQPDIARYRDWIREELAIGELFDTTPVLTEEMRDTLALARFLWEQIDYIRASNFAAPTLLLTGVLEEATIRTIYDCCKPLCTQDGRPLQRTLGTLGNSKGFGGANWVILECDIVQAKRWNEQVLPEQTLSFSAWIDQIKDISSIRNEAAHKANTSTRSFRRLTAQYFGDDRRIGLLNGLLRAW